MRTMRKLGTYALAGIMALAFWAVLSWALVGTGP